MGQLAIPPGHQQTVAKRLVIPQAGEEANESLRGFYINHLESGK